MAVDSIAAYGPSLVRAADAVSRQSIVVRAEGGGVATVPRQHTFAQTIMVGGTVYYVGVGLLAGDVITGISLSLTNAGVAMTLSKAGIYSPSGSRVALSADQGTAWESAGMKTAPLTASYTVPSNGHYYLAIVGAGGTLPTVTRSSAQSAASGFSTAIGTGIRPYAAEAGQADLPTTATFADALFAPWLQANF